MARSQERNGSRAALCEALSRSIPNTVSVFRNVENGTFAAKVDYPVGAYPAGVRAFDANHDALCANVA